MPTIPFSFGLNSAPSQSSSWNPVCFTPKELKEILGDNPEIVGEGSFGKVYRGNLHSTAVAVKKLDEKKLKDHKIDFKKEVAMLSSLSHPHIVLLIGFCSVEGSIAIVTEFLPGGSLKKRLEIQGSGK